MYKDFVEMNAQGIAGSALLNTQQLHDKETHFSGNSQCQLLKTHYIYWVLMNKKSKYLC